jgi:hypothetical protein
MKSNDKEKGEAKFLMWTRVRVYPPFLMKLLRRIFVRSHEPQINISSY